MVGRLTTALVGARGGAFNGGGLASFSLTETEHGESSKRVCLAALRATKLMWALDTCLLGILAWERVDVMIVASPTVSASPRVLDAPSINPHSSSVFPASLA